MTDIALKVGDKAPDFTLKNQNDQEVRLSSLTGSGKRVLLSFHPLAWTSVCELQMRALELKAPSFEELGTVALGLSVDSGPSKKAWAASMGVEKTDLLADFNPFGKVTRDYDLWVEKLGASGRANIVVGADGTIEWIKVYPIPRIPDIEAVIEFLQG